MHIFDHPRKVIVIGGGTDGGLLPLLLLLAVLAACAVAVVAFVIEYAVLVIGIAAGTVLLTAGLIWLLWRFATCRYWPQPAPPRKRAPVVRRPAAITTAPRPAIEAPKPQWPYVTPAGEREHAR